MLQFISLVSTKSVYLAPLVIKEEKDSNNYGDCVLFFSEVIMKSFNYCHYQNIGRLLS